MANTFWRDAARGGVIIGAIVVAGLYLGVWFVDGRGALSVVELIAVFFCLHRLGRRRAMLCDPAAGYSFGQNMGFVMALMLFTGFIYGLSYYFLVNFVAPEMADTMAEMALTKGHEIYGGNMVDGMEGIFFRMLANPFFWVFYGILAMIFYGGIVGLFVSPFVKRNPEPLHDN